MPSPVPRVAVYTIALNEERFAPRWAASCAGADYRVVADTGSTDGTVEALRALGVSVQTIAVSPWRFDHARNASLSLVPPDADVCIAMDMDEVLAPGWLDILRRVWVGNVNRVRYTYIWNWVDGKPGLVFAADKIHGRGTHHWRYPAHECATPREGVTEVYGEAPGLVIEHHADDTKSRSSYLGLLRLGAQELPQDGRMAHYHGRELMFAGSHREAIEELRRHVALPATWVVERAQSMLYLGRCHAALGEHGQAERWFVASAWEAPAWRDPWVDLAQMHHNRKDWHGGWWAAERALAITAHTSAVGRTSLYWGALPWDLASVCAWWAGAKDRARECVRHAAALDQANERIRRNVALMFDGAPAPAIRA